RTGAGRAGAAHGGGTRGPHAVRSEGAPAAPAGVDQVPVHGQARHPRRRPQTGLGLSEESGVRSQEEEHRAPSVKYATLDSLFSTLYTPSPACPREGPAG